jgi:hypothetical protein
MPNAESGFSMVEVSKNRGYLGAFALKPFIPKLTMMGFAMGSYSSFASLSLGYLVQKCHSFNAIAFMMDNNTHLDSPDERLILSYTYQFN